MAADHALLAEIQQVGIKQMHFDSQPLLGVG